MIDPDNLGHKYWYVFNMIQKFAEMGIRSAIQSNC